MNNLKEMAILALLCVWETGKMIGFILLILVSIIYLAEPALDFVLDYLYVCYLKETLIVIFTLWFVMSAALYSCVQRIKK